MYPRDVCCPVKNFPFESFLEEHCSPSPEIQDDTSSTASYEDIGRRNRMYPNKEELAMIPGKRTLDPEEMPEILYTAEYRSANGKVLECVYNLSQLIRF